MTDAHRTPVAVDWPERMLAIRDAQARLEALQEAQKALHHFSSYEDRKPVVAEIQAVVAELHMLGEVVRTPVLVMSDV